MNNMNFIENIRQWLALPDHFFYILLIIVVLSGGVLLAKIVAYYTKKTCASLKIDETWGEFLIPSAFWTIIILTGSLSVNLLANKILNININWLSSITFSVSKAFLVFALGSALITFLTGILSKLISVSKIDTTLHPFLISVFKALAFLLLIVACIELLGIPTASMVAAMASAGLALSLSVKDHLSNLIGGVIVLITKPFKCGDYIEFDGVSGLVEEIGLIYTILKTFDNKNIYIPNNDAARAKITNHSQEPMRRLDLTFSIGYNDDYDKAREIILRVAHDTKLIHTEPAPIVRMSNLGSSSIEIACKLWVDWQDYYELNWSMHENIKREFDSNNIKIPFNQLDVHIAKDACPLTKGVELEKE